MAKLVGARAYNSGNIAISNNTVTALTFDSERFDTDTIHSTSTNTGRLTCNTAGKYLIIAQVQWAAAAGGRRAVRIRLNGSTNIAIEEEGSVADAIGNPQFTVSTIYDLSVSDYVECVVYHTQGGPLNVSANGNWSPEFMMHRIG